MNSRKKQELNTNLNLIDYSCFIGAKTFNMTLINNKNTFKNILVVLKLMGYSYIVVVGIIFFYNILQNIYPNYIQDISETRNSFNSKISDQSLYLKFLLMVVYSPFLEELIFRFGITKKRDNLYLLLLATLVYVILPLTKGKILFSTAVFIYPMIQFFLHKFLKDKTYYFKLSIIVSAIYFGLIHIFNFDHEVMDSILSYAIMIIPLIVFGYTFGHLRVKFGILYAILAHMILNLIGFLSNVM